MRRRVQVARRSAACLLAAATAAYAVAALPLAAGAAAVPSELVLLEKNVVRTVVDAVHINQFYAIQ